VFVFLDILFGLNHIFGVDESELLCVLKPGNAIVKKRLRMPQVLSEGTSLSRGYPPGNIYVW
jgi:hypothetical protein